MNRSVSFRVAFLGVLALAATAASPAGGQYSQIPFDEL
jgi:hypothetical protein